jgi:hypothetical protein
MRTQFIPGEIIVQLQCILSSVNGQDNGVNETQTDETKVFCDCNLYKIINCTNDTPTKRPYVAMEPRVSVSLLPCLTVIDGVIMIYRVRQRGTKAGIEASNSESLKEYRVVTTAAKQGNSRPGEPHLFLLFVIDFQHVLVNDIVAVFEETFERPLVVDGVPQSLARFRWMRNVF